MNTELNNLWASAVAGPACILADSPSRAGYVTVQWPIDMTALYVVHRLSCIEWAMIEHDEVDEHVAKMQAQRARAAAHYGATIARSTRRDEIRIRFKRQLDASPPSSWKDTHLSRNAWANIKRLRTCRAVQGGLFAHRLAVLRKLPDNAPGKMVQLAKLRDAWWSNSYKRVGAVVPQPVGLFDDELRSWQAITPIGLPSAVAGALGDNPHRYRAHMMRRSEEDPTQVAYFQSFDKFKRGVLTRTRLGRYLTAHWSDVLDEKQIREAAAFHAASMSSDKAASTLRFIESDDPDGWEWVYEHGYKFSSCMMHNRTWGRSDCHVDSRLTDEDHPVRAYALAGNGLRLAYLGDKAGTPNGRVYARAIVRDHDDTETASYVRIFGDDSLKHHLEREGYAPGHTYCLEGVHLARRETPRHVSYDGIIVPYLDCDDAFNDEGDYLEITRYGDLSANSYHGWVSTEGAETFTCERCHSTHDDEDYLHYSEYEDTGYCSSCDDDFVCAYVSASSDHQDMVLETNAIEVGGSWYANDERVLAYHDIYECTACSEHAHLDDMTSTAEGAFCGCTEIVELHEECDEGYDYAAKDDATQYFSREQGAWVWLADNMDVDEEEYRDFGPDDANAVPLAEPCPTGWDYAHIDDAVELYSPADGTRKYLHVDGAFYVVTPGYAAAYDASAYQFDGAPWMKVFAEEWPAPDETYYIALHPQLAMQPPMNVAQLCLPLRVALGVPA